MDSIENVVQAQSYAETVKPVAHVTAPEHAGVSENQTMTQNITIRPVFSKQGAEGENGEQKEKNQANDKQLQMAVSDANNKMKMKQSKTKAEFSYHEPTKSVSIKIMDEDTNEVIKEIPPQETLDMIVKMWELAGIMVDEKR